jgi:hypothetical protein
MEEYQRTPCSLDYFSGFLVAWDSLPLRRLIVHSAEKLIRVLSKFAITCERTLGDICQNYISDGLCSLQFFDWSIM